MSLSDRIRPNSEAAPWVIEEVKRMEALLRRAFDHMDLESRPSVVELRRDIEKVLNPSRFLPNERHPSRIVERVQLLTDPAYTPLGTASQTLGKFPIR